MKYLVAIFFIIFSFLEIAKALRRNSTLRSLDLSWNGLGDEGAKVLLEALGDNTNLSFLNIASNRIGDAGMLFYMLYAHF